EDLERQLGVLDRGDAERGHYYHPVGVVQHLQVDLAQVAAAVHDDVVEHLAQLGEDPAHVVDRDQVGQLRADRGQEDLDPDGPVHHHLPDEFLVHVLDVLDQVGDPLRVVQVEEHADVPELEV